MHRCAEEGFARTLSIELPGRLLGDKAYDSDALDGRLEEAWVIEMIAPNRKNAGQDARWPSLAGTAAAGTSSGCLLGCKTFVILFYHMNFLKKIF